ncbi:hypothetical protein [Uliginosibacterium sp. 31-12]|uniref:hypothetical protein n=1 Tax=Uliginosibacterium sp. 31-12 TaxID=3062781 RepID=UPI0026E33F45|nr:hypothetical protein [Uliginosibacterium sp. 31-12]MDO6385601.1 hypothetical protein [Uliginosibacterium sp. 31-12]
MTAELLSTDLSAAALMVMVSDLSAYPEDAVLAALVRCRRELTGRLSLAAIIERVQGADGRPGPDEAWATAMLAGDEQETVVWTQEMAAAYHQAAHPLLVAGDKIGARMAFREAYSRMVAEAQQAGISPAWSASLGGCPVKRKAAIERAQARKQLTGTSVRALLPAVKHEGTDPVAALVLNSPVRLVASNGETVKPLVEDASVIRERLAQLRAKVGQA